MSATELLQDRYGSSMMLTYGMPPVALSRGQGCTVWDVDGNSYLDLIAGIAVSALGHGHPAIIEAVSRQVGTLAHVSNLFLHERQVELAERLIGLLGTDGRVFFANSGAEANEAALKLVRKAQGADRPVVVAAEHSFHGRTMGALSLTGKDSIRLPFGPFGVQVRAQGLKEPVRGRDHPMMAALALGHHQPPVSDLHVGEPQPQHLAPAQPGQQHAQHDRPVPVRAQRADQTVSFLRRQDPWQGPRHPHQRRGT